jgi:hypothetical protein
VRQAFQAEIASLNSVDLHYESVVRRACAVLDAPGAEPPLGGEMWKIVLSIGGVVLSVFGGSLATIVIDPLFPEGLNLWLR